MKKREGQASDVPIERFPVRPDVLLLPFTFCGLLHSLHLSYSKKNCQDAGIPSPTPHLLQLVRVPVHVAVYVSSLPRCQVGVINSVPRRLSPSGQVMAFWSQIFTRSSYFPPLWLFGRLRDGFSRVPHPAPRQDFQKHESLLQQTPVKVQKGQRYTQGKGSTISSTVSSSPRVTSCSVHRCDPERHQVRQTSTEVTFWTTSPPSTTARSRTLRVLCKYQFILYNCHNNRDNC